MTYTKQRGFVKTIILILIALIALSYFGIDLEQATKGPLFVKNVSFTWHVIEKVWTDYIWHPLSSFLPKTSTGGQ
ncbi:MAG: hypothetical protein A3C06_04805 [Candidatus Taylorbacteria bacterium RIFCSPHIGHO2_02_FULL_46_13]|uniref:Uncharacterized protein n=1 Tax=Candidatus Taylorbacteria bacterium RIFCSPHIGHO2_02_FULL_46_13 TaxID=1802312 RepID=A0A1G2MTK6_9BACT|nr:MAG: hypothetical protein A3C06_04805 [Candidatus Taylorbacteria bacterium RIFCSPHIGHO2_02_FULL_46_13]